MRFKYNNAFSEKDSKDRLKQGVYMLYHEESPNINYIGYTYCKGGFYMRLRLHISRLKKDDNANSKLFDVVLERGIHGLRLKILKICFSLNECIEEEINFIKKIAPNCNVITPKPKKKFSIPFIQKDFKSKDIKNWPFILSIMDVGDVYETNLKHYGGIRIAISRCKDKKFKTRTKDEKIKLFRIS